MRFYCIQKNDDLVHHGVKGMKWGVINDKKYITKNGLYIRRNRNIHGSRGLLDRRRVRSDGSLTKSGVKERNEFLKKEALNRYKYGKGYETKQYNPHAGAQRFFTPGKIGFGAQYMVSRLVGRSFGSSLVNAGITGLLTKGLFGLVRGRKTNKLLKAHRKEIENTLQKANKKDRKPEKDLLNKFKKSRYDLSNMDAKDRKTLNNLFKKGLMANAVKLSDLTDTHAFDIPKQISSGKPLNKEQQYDYYYYAKLGLKFKYPE